MNEKELLSAATVAAAKGSHRTYDGVSNRVTNPGIVVLTDVTNREEDVGFEDRSRLGTSTVSRPETLEQGVGKREH